MTAQPIERNPALREERRRSRPMDAAHGPTFASLGVPVPLTAALAAAGIDAPFPIQAAVVPDALAGADILGRGRTGSGKTLGFCIPLAARLAGGHTSAGDNRSLIFTRTKHGARKLARQLTAAGIPAAELHGNLTQATRERNLARFASGAVRVLVATDIAARGIHVDGIDLVIHADPPAEHKAYLHRSGRTGRAGASGVVVTLQTPAQAGDVRALIRKAGVIPLAATARPGAALLRSIAGNPAKAHTPQPHAAAAPETTSARPATGHRAAALSARYQGQPKRKPQRAVPARSC